MIWLNDVVIGMAISQLALLGAYFSLHHWQQPLGRWMTLFCVCLSAYLLAQLSGLADQPLVTYVLYRFALATPAILWVIAVLLFVDNPKITRPVWALLGGYMVLRAIGALFYTLGESLSLFWFIAIYVLPHLVMLGVSVHSVYIAYAGRQDDLVEDRRRVRVPFVVAMGVLLTVIVGRGFLAIPDIYLGQNQFVLNQSVAAGWSDLIFSSYIFLIIAAFNIKIFRLHHDVFHLFEPAQPVMSSGRVKPFHAVNQKLIDTILKTMEEGRLYSISGLTIGDFANTLSMQEYKLRKIIKRDMN